MKKEQSTSTFNYHSCFPVNIVCIAFVMLFTIVCFCDCFLKQYLYCFCTFKENECLKALSVLEENGRMEQLLSYLQMFHHAISLVFLFLIFEPIKS